MTDEIDPVAGFAPGTGPGEPLAGQSPQLKRPVKTTLAFTERCNLDCRLCYADCGCGTREEMSLDQWLPVLDELEAAGVLCVYVEGGEPLLRPDCLPLLEASTPRFFTMLRTHGTLIDDAVAERLAAMNIGIVLVDIWGATAATHDALTGAPGSFEKSCAAVRRLTEAGVEAQTLFILNRENAEETNAYLQLARDLGARTAGILRLYPLGRVKRNWSEYALSLEEMTEVIEGLAPPDGLRVMQSWHPRDANCCWQMSAINAYGDSIGCAYLREYVNYGSVLEQPFLETWNHPVSRRLRAGRVREACGDCTQSQGSRGGCRATAYAFHGDFDAPDPFDKGLNDGTDLRVLPDGPLHEAS